MSQGERDESQALELYRDYLMMVARGKIGFSYRGKIDAEDVVNQSLFTAHRQYGDYRGTSQPELMGWLKSILTNQINDALRYLHRDKRDIDKEQPLAVREWDQSCSSQINITCGLTSPSMKAVKHEQELMLAAALASLPDQQRTAVECRYFHGYSTAETAETMECSVAAVAGLLRRGLKALRAELNSEADLL